jgi:endo-1,4-beta-mannosidase
VIVSFCFMNYFETDLNKIFVKQVLQKLKDYKNVIYDIQNEPDIEAQYIPARRKTIVNWCNQMTQFVKKGDPTHHLVTIGFSGLDLIASREINLDNIDIACFHIGIPDTFLLKNRVETLRNILRKRGHARMPVAIEEVGMSSKDLSEKSRAEHFQKLYQTAKNLEVPIFIWWCLRDVSVDPTAVDGDRIWIEPHRWGVFNADFSRKDYSTDVAIEIGKEASSLNFEKGD